MNAKKIIILTRDLNVAIMLTARKNEIKIQEFKKLIMFRIIFEKNTKILKLNDF